MRVFVGAPMNFRSEYLPNHRSFILILSNKAVKYFVLQMWLYIVTLESSKYVLPYPLTYKLKEWCKFACFLLKEKNIRYELNYSAPKIFLQPSMLQLFLSNPVIIILMILFKISNQELNLCDMWIKIKTCYEVKIRERDLNCRLKFWIKDFKTLLPAAYSPPPAPPMQTSIIAK